MHTFSTENHKWEVDIDFLTVDRLRTTTAYDLLNHEQTIKQVFDSVEIYKLLWHLVEEQATARGVTALQFSKLLRPVFKEARDALLREITEFFQCSQNPDRALAIEEMRQTVLAAVTRFEQEAESIRDKASQLVQAKLQTTFGDLAGSLDRMLCEEVALSANSTSRPKDHGSA